MSIPLDAASSPRSEFSSSPQIGFLSDHLLIVQLLLHIPVIVTHKPCQYSITLMDHTGDHSKSPCVIQNILKYYRGTHTGLDHCAVVQSEMWTHPKQLQWRCKYDKDVYFEATHPHAYLELDLKCHSRNL